MCTLVALKRQALLTIHNKHVRRVLLLQVGQLQSQLEASSGRIAELEAHGSALAADKARLEAELKAERKRLAELQVGASYSCNGPCTAS